MDTHKYRSQLGDSEIDARNLSEALEDFSSIVGHFSRPIPDDLIDDAIKVADKIKANLLNIKVGVKAGGK